MIEPKLLLHHMKMIWLNNGMNKTYIFQLFLKIKTTLIKLVQILKIFQINIGKLIFQRVIKILIELKYSLKLHNIIIITIREFILIQIYVVILIQQFLILLIIMIDGFKLIVQQ